MSSQMKLFDGREIEFEAISKKSGKPYTARGKLEKQKFNGREFYGFKPDFS